MGLDVQLTVKPYILEVTSSLNILNLKKNRMLSPKYFSWMLVSTAEVLMFFFFFKNLVESSLVLKIFS